MTLIAPLRPDNGGHAVAKNGYGAAYFQIDWAAQTVTCPQGKVSVEWRPKKDARDEDIIHVRFAHADCRPYPAHALCTRSEEARRMIAITPQTQHDALRDIRQRKKTDAFTQEYANRAGVESTLSQGVRAFVVRRSRYIGLQKTHLHLVATAVGVNVLRVSDWLAQVPRAKTCCSAFAALRMQN